jgi:hypothetical protein
MNTNSDQRSGVDSRKQTGFIVLPFVEGNDNRGAIKQQEDEGIINFVDQHSPVLFGAIVAVIFVWVGDAILNYIY